MLAHQNQVQTAWDYEEIDEFTADIEAGLPGDDQGGQ
jgi:hypothetical protein